jgi:ABC-2 type transport system ATP-binding protein
VRILVTLLRATRGTARVAGFDTGRQPHRVRQVIGYAGQSVGVDDDLTVSENLAVTGFVHGLRHDESWRRAAELASTFSLAEVANARAGRLSGGLRRRLDLAQALVHRPAVLFLDEPTAGLDPQSRNSLWAQLRDLARYGTTVFLTTQYLEEADRACDRVAILDGGRLVKTGTPAALKDEVGGGRLAVTLRDRADRARAARALGALPGLARVVPAGPAGLLVVYVRDARASIAPLIRLLDAVTMLAQGAIILGIGLLMGARLRAGLPGGLLFVAGATAFGVVWACMANLIALRTRNAELTMVAGLLLTLPALFMTPAFFPKPLLPGWLQAAAAGNPAAYVVETGQRLMSTGNDWGQDLRTVAALAAAGLVLIPAAVCRPPGGG